MLAIRCCQVPFLWQVWHRFRTLKTCFAYNSLWDAVKAPFTDNFGLAVRCSKHPFQLQLRLRFQVLSRPPFCRQIGPRCKELLRVQSFHWKHLSCFQVLSKQLFYSDIIGLVVRYCQNPFHWQLWLCWQILSRLPLLITLVHLSHIVKICALWSHPCAL